MKTFENSTPTLFDGMELPTSTSSAGASRARTSVAQALALVWLESDLASGDNTRDSLARYDHASSSWKTSQLSLITESEPFSETWPASGTMLNGLLFRRAPWVLHTCDSECSLWPTPTASMDGRGFGIPLHTNTGRYKLSTVLRVHALVKEHGWRIHPNFTEALMDFPMGWTEIAPLETAFTQEPQKSLGVSRSPLREPSP